MTATPTDTKRKSLFSDAEHTRIDRWMRELEWNCFLAKNVHKEMDGVRHRTMAFLSGVVVFGSLMHFKWHPALSVFCGISIGAIEFMKMPGRSSSYVAYEELERKARDMREFKMYDPLVNSIRFDVENLFVQKRVLDEKSHATLGYMWIRAKIRLADHKKTLLG